MTEDEDRVLRYHIRTCSERYASIERNLSELSKRLARLEYAIFFVLASVVLSLLDSLLRHGILR